MSKGKSTKNFAKIKLEDVLEMSASSFEEDESSSCSNSGNGCTGSCNHSSGLTK